MYKRIVSFVLAVMMSTVIGPLALAAVLATVDATYNNGIVTVTGTGFSSSNGYIVRVVNKTLSNIVAMDQVKSDVSGTLTANVTTGTLTTMTDYVVYVNKQDGTIAAQDLTLTNNSTPTYVGGGNTTGTKSPDVNTANGKVTTNVTGTSDSSGKISGSIGSDTAQALIDSARKIEASGGAATLYIKVEGVSTSGSAEVGIKMADFKNIASQTSSDVSVSTTVGTVTFNSKAVDAIAGSASADLKIDIKKVDTSTLSSAVKAQVGDRLVYDFSITSGTSNISDFGGGSAKVSLPYTPKSGEDPNAVVVYYIDASGVLSTVQGAYDSSTGNVSFVTAHFSSYVIGYNKVSFDDVSSSAWYSNPVTFIAARGITSGVDSTHFAPDMVITRGQFIVMILKAYGISPSTGSEDNFSDAGNTYYTGYLAAAKKLGLSNGLDGSIFAPDSQITRQDAFTLVYRTLGILNEVPADTTNKTIQNFTDYSNVSDYAETALNALIGAGVVSGNSGNLNPAAYCSRAEMAQILYKLLSL